MCRLIPLRGQIQLLNNCNAAHRAALLRATRPKALDLITVTAATLTDALCTPLGRNVMTRKTPSALLMDASSRTSSLLLSDLCGYEVHTHQHDLAVMCRSPDERLS